MQPAKLPTSFLIASTVGPVFCLLFAVAVRMTEDPQARSLITNVLLPVIGAVAATAAVRRVRASHGRRRAAWVSLATALGLGVVANSLALLFDLGFVSAEWRALNNLLLVAAMISSVIGLTLFPPARRRLTDLSRLILDGLIIGGSVLFLASVVVFPSLLAGHEGSLFEQFQVLALPVLDLLLATLAALLIARSGAASRTPLLLVGSAFLLYAVSDMAYAVNTSSGAAGLGSWWDLGWFGGYVFAILAALHPDAGDAPQPESHESSALLSTLVCCSIFLLATAVTIDASTHGELSVPQRVLWGVLVFVVVVRQVALVLDNEQLRRSLEDRVLQRTRELREITRQTELLLASVADGIYGVDKDGFITMVNDATTKLLGRPASKLIGADAHELFHAPRSDGAPYPKDGCYITEATRSGLIASGEDDEYVRGDGETILVEATASPLSSEGGISGAVVVFRDVSERREMDRMKQEFISFVSHELRTPLTSIRGALGLIAGGALGQVPPKAAKMIDIATSGSVRLGRLVDDILDIERLESGMLPLTITSVDVAAACREAVAATAGMAQAAGVTIDLGPVGGLVRADRDRIVQVLINLLGNAVRFSSHGCDVRLETTPRVETIEFAVIDNGRGIPAEKLDTIFGRFNQVDAADTREKGGSGLGLAICRGLVERMGGRIWAESVVGEGSTFRFELPAEEGGETPSAEAPAEAIGAGAGRGDSQGAERTGSL